MQHGLVNLHLLDEPLQDLPLRHVILLNILVQLLAQRQVLGLHFLVGFPPRMRRRINVINSFAGTNRRASMMFSLCREFAFNVAHGIARWQKNLTDDTYHPSWENFDDSDGESESESD